METESIFNDSGDEDQMEHEDVPEEDTGNREDEAEEVPAPGEQEKQAIKPKRVVKNPLPKLDAIRLMGPRGIGILQNTMKDLKFRGKGHEQEDLNMLMKKLEHWAHRLFPKFPFDDTLKQIEKLGNKKPVQNMVKRIRLDMFQSDEIMGSTNEAEQVTEKAPDVDVFDELLGTGPFADSTNRRAEQNTQRAPEPDVFDELIGTRRDEESQAEVITLTPIPSSKPMTLTEEQRERMERNRKLALERRNARLLEQEKEKSTNDGTQSSQIDSPSSSQHKSVPTFDDIQTEKSFDNNCHKESNNNCVTLTDGSEMTSQFSSDTSSKISVSIGEDTDDVQIVETDNCPIDESSETERKDGTKLNLSDDKLVKKNAASKSPEKDVFTEDDILGFINEA